MLPILAVQVIDQAEEDSHAAAVIIRTRDPSEAS